MIANPVTSVARAAHETLAGVPRVWRYWKRIARRIGDIQARVVLTLLYFLPLAPFALAVKWGTDPMAIKRHTPKGWRPTGDAGYPAGASRQF